MERTRFYDLNKLVGIALRIADAVDSDGEEGDWKFPNKLGFGYRALSGYLRDGAKAAIDVQSSYYHANERRECAEIGETEMRKFVDDIFGDTEAETLNDEYKEKIREFVKNLLDEEEVDDDSGEI